MQKYTQGDKIKNSLACPKMGAKPTGTAKSVPRGTNFKPKGMGGKR